MTEGKQENKKCCTGGKIWKDGKCVLPEVTFTAFVMSLTTTCLLHLGEIDDPATGQKVKDSVLAKHTIDTLDLLESKTKGNLSEEESRILKEAAYDLKMRFVKNFG